MLVELGEAWLAMVVDHKDALDHDCSKFTALVLTHLVYRELVSYGIQKRYSEFRRSRRSPILDRILTRTGQRKANAGECGGEKMCDKEKGKKAENPLGKQKSAVMCAKYLQDASFRRAGLLVCFPIFSSRFCGGLPVSHE